MPVAKSGTKKRSVRLPAFAKINLCLHVLGKRPDGFHELRTIFQAISLHDTLELSRTSQPGIFLETDDPSLPAGPGNLVHRAIDAVACETGFRGGIRARLEKKIPVARGLGGGSGDAAAALIGMLRLTKKKLPLARLMEIAAGLGADVPFFLFGGRALAVNRGDEIYPLPDAPRRTIVVVSPKDIGVSTKDAYQWLSAELTKRAKRPNIWGFCALCWSRQESGISNDFEGPVFSRHPRLEEIRDGLLKRGAADAALAGSGSAVFGVFRNPAQARRTARAFREDSVFVVETLSRERYGRALGWTATGSGGVLGR
ncbi:MAG TPA: 4-(cytidine 5'-diphospho)-2-C-methyl-D-erythritol kinase [Candidatus Acidoferrales bacterium]|nr:4-(cytidine 5'-diphospho)-2-C-methyl-D-erythritol kinase [Candidatus Acidoferrales bacterium]